MRGVRQVIGARLRRAVAIVGAGVLAGALLVGLPAVVDTPTDTSASAADLSAFSPGNIISDAVFFDRGTMTEAQIQAFLQSKVPSCQSGYTCLKDWYDTSRTTSADAMCGAYSGGVRERAATIIYKVAQACGINPRVILVTLQKEQGLVTHTWPSDWRYTIAMGQGCPDTAACDTRYYGFFNQVYGAAWQLKRYANPPGTSQYFTWYAPGRTWNVLYNPNRNCGSSPVLIRNQATANLYYYTPYQPNSAALRAGYGEGDGCSSYGNRNFFQYFTDWFGSTQYQRATVASANGDIYLLVGSTAYHIQLEDWPAYQAAFGTPNSTTPAVIASYANGGQATRYVRNETNGQIAYLDSGDTHAFATCEQVSAWGGSCTSGLTRMSGDEFASIGAGAAMTSYARRSTGGQVHLLSGTSLSPIYNAATVSLLNGGQTPFAATMRESVSARYSITRTRFAPARFLTPAGSSRTLLPTADGRLFHLPSWSRATDLGLPSTVFSPSVASAALNGYSEAGTLQPFVRCNGTVYFGASGTLYPVTAAAATGFSVTDLDATTCRALKLATGAAASKLFVKSATGSAIYIADNGAFRHITSVAVLQGLNGGKTPTIRAVTAATMAGLPQGTPRATAVTPGTFVQNSSTGQAYLATSETELLAVPLWNIATELGLTRTVSLNITTAQLAGTTQTGQLSPFVMCGGTTYVASRGTLRAVTAAAVAGFDVSSLGAVTCGKLTRSGAAALNSLFLQPVGSSSVYFAEDGALRHVTSLALLVELGGGSTPPILPMDAAVLNRLPQGTAIRPAPPVLTPGQLVLNSSDGRVSLVVDVSSVLHLPSWTVARELGIPTTIARTLTPVETSGLTQLGSLTQFVSCAGTTYYGAQGTLRAVTASAAAGFSVGALDAATCGRLTRSSQPALQPLFVQAIGSDAVYLAERGVFRHVTSYSVLTQLAGGTSPQILRISADALALSPKGAAKSSVGG